MTLLNNNADDEHVTNNNNNTKRSRHTTRPLGEEAEECLPSRIIMS